MSVALLADAASLRTLRPEWEVLWHAVPGADPFRSPWWLLPWWECFGTGEPRVLTWREDGVLRGVLPAYVLRDGGGARMLPMGAGTTDYLGPLGDGAEPMLHALLDVAARDGVTRCDLFDLPPDSVLAGAAAPPGWRAERGNGTPCPVMRLPSLPHGIRRNLNLARNRAARAGGIERGTATVATLDVDLATLAALHAARWARNGEAGVMADPAVKRFLHLAAPGLLSTGLLRLITLRLNGSPVAAALALLDPERIHLYLSGYDPDRAAISPGTLLLGTLVEEAAAEGRTELHFLRGREGYKYAWGAIDRMNRTLLLMREGDGSGSLAPV